MNDNTIPNWLLSEIEQCKTKGFFRSESAEQTARRIISTSKGSYFGDILGLRGDPLFKQMLLSYDKTQVWFIENRLELGATKEFREDFYPNVFRILKQISNGQFKPTNIITQECGYCEGRGKRLEVSFTLHNHAYAVNFCTDADVLVLSFLEEINELIELEGASFQTIIPDSYGACCVLFLNHPQKEWLSEVMDWDFIKHERYWLDKAQFLRQQGNIPSASTCFEKATQTQNDFDAISEFAEFLMDQKLTDSALKWYKSGVQYLETAGQLDENQKWWLVFFQNKIKKLEAN